MLELFTANFSTIITAIALVLVLAAIMLKMRRDKKKGKSTCGCSCAGCPSAGVCHQPPTKNML